MYIGTKGPTTMNPGHTCSRSSPLGSCMTWWHMTFPRISSVAESSMDVHMNVLWGKLPHHFTMTRKQETWFEKIFLCADTTYRVSMGGILEWCSYFMNGCTVPKSMVTLGIMSNQGPAQLLNKCLLILDCCVRMVCDMLGMQPENCIYHWIAFIDICIVQNQ
jgi:hypothetical protein